MLQLDDSGHAPFRELDEEQDMEPFQKHQCPSPAERAMEERPTNAL